MIHLQGLIRGSGVGSVAVVDRCLDGTFDFTLNADTPFHAASTMKVGVLMEVFRQAREGRFSLDDRLPIRNSFVGVADGKPYSLQPDDDADPDLYRAKELPIRALARQMIVRSSNLATNLLLDLVTVEEAQALMSRLGAPGVRIVRGVEDKVAYRAGLNNTVTANGLAELLTKLARREAVSSPDDEAMLEILLAQELNEGIPAGLPPGTPIAHKTGWNDVAYHDAAIIDPFGPSPRMLVILTTGRGSMEDGGAFVASLTRALRED